MDELIKAYNDGVLARSAAIEAAATAKLEALNKVEADHQAAVQKVQDEAAAADAAFSEALAKAGKVLPGQANNRSAATAK